MAASEWEKYNQSTEIRFATREDIPAVMKFIGQYWKEGHVLSRDLELFAFQHVYGDEVTFVLCVDRASGELDGVLGYIPYGTEGDRDIFTAIWKMRKTAGFMQGTELIRFLEEKGRCKNLYCVGLASGAVSIMKYMRKKIADYEHYYILNPDRKEYKIGEIYTRLACGRKNMTDMWESKWEKISDFERIKDVLVRGKEKRFPYKTPEFVKRRYFEHPGYSYDKWHISMGDRQGLLVCRKQEALGEKIYRVIDLLGDLECIRGCGGLLEQIITENGYEYADCLVCGMEEKVMEEAGFARKREEDGNILPEYFAPFEKRNVTIHNFMPKNVNAVMFKGDGDQDRPNVAGVSNRINVGLLQIY